MSWRQCKGMATISKGNQCKWHYDSTLQIINASINEAETMYKGTLNNP